MNRIEIKYYDNIKVQASEDPFNIKNGGFNFEHELINESLNDYYEFYIDGTPLVKIILSFYSSYDSKWFLTNKNGLLGTRPKKYDELLVMALLNNKLGVKKVIEHFRTYNEILNEQQAASLIIELGLKNPLIYGCKICGDSDCGGVDIRVENDSNKYYWYFYNEKSKKFDNKLFTFSKTNYEMVFKGYLNNWSRAKRGNKTKHV